MFEQIKQGVQGNMNKQNQDKKSNLCLSLNVTIIYRRLINLGTEDRNYNQKQQRNNDLHKLNNSNYTPVIGKFRLYLIFW